MQPILTNIELEIPDLFSLLPDELLEYILIKASFGQSIKQLIVASPCRRWRKQIEVLTARVWDQLDFFSTQTKGESQETAILLLRLKITDEKHVSPPLGEQRGAICLHRLSMILKKQLPKRGLQEVIFQHCSSLTLLFYQTFDKAIEDYNLKLFWQELCYKIRSIHSLKTLESDAIREWMSQVANQDTLKSITEFRVESERVTRLPKEIRLLTQLQELNLDSNQILEISSEIRLLTQLQELNLEDNQIKKIPLEIRLLTQLRWLRLENNQIKEIPSEIGQLTQLQELDLSKNQIKKIPSEIGQLDELQWLYLDNNQIKEIPSEIGRLTQLEWLSLQQNQIKEIPSEIGQLTQLQGLHLENNQIKEIPSEIGQLTKLMRLYLSDNQIKKIPPEIGQLTRLRELHLEENQINEISPSIHKLSKLKYYITDSN